MARNATVHKVDLQVSDIDRGYYNSHALTVALHPSETVRRMMRRVVVFALYASDRLVFTKGISTDDEPDLWELDDTGLIKLWVELGQPDERRIRKACGKAEQVIVATHDERVSQIWWDQIKSKMSRFSNLDVVFISEASIEALEAMATRTMRLTATVQDNELMVSDGETVTQVQARLWYPARDS